MSEKTLYLLDGHALIYRAHFAFISRPLINSKGLNTSAITGFTRTLWDLLKNRNPSHVGVSFDISGHTFRNELYEEYKANRDKQPEDITTALPIVQDILKAFKIPIVTLENYEADDVIGTLAKQAEKEGFKVYMITSDKDYGQLVSENVFMYKPSSRGNGVEIIGVNEVCKKWDIDNPMQVIDILGLAGDSSDNIPGVPGVGPKTASKLLKKYNSLEGILENIEELKGKTKERFEEHREQALLSKKLATIIVDSPVNFNAQDFHLDEPDRDTLAEIFKELEFRSLARQILQQPEAQETYQSQELFSSEKKSTQAPNLTSHSIAEKTMEDVDVSYSLVTEEKELKNLAQRLENADLFCFDTETTALNPMEAEIVGMSVSVKEHEAFYIPIPEDKEEARAIVEIFKPALENENIVKIAQNIKYDIIILKHYDVRVAGLMEDTMLIHYLLEPGMRHSMDYLSEVYLKYKPIPITSLIGKKGKKQGNMRDLSPEKVLNYAAEDADITLQLYNYLKGDLKKQDLRNLYLEIEEPLIDVLADMEYNGIKLDKEQLREFGLELKKTIAETNAEIYEKAGTKFNIASPKQVGEVLFDLMGIPYRWKKTKTGQYSTAEAKLQELAGENRIIERILHYRSLTKLKSTYVDALPKVVNKTTGRIHSSFNQALVSSGRLSSNNPNLQNIPIRTELGRRVRKAFVPRGEDYELLAADYSQIELRIIAGISGEKAMIDAFKENRDIHRATAALVYDVDYDDVTQDQRRSAKTVNFSIIYGAGSTNLSQQLDISRSEAKKLIDQYFNTYKGLKKYMDEVVKVARERGYVRTLFGRKLKLRDIDSRNGMLRSQAERIAINMPIQGTAAGLIKKAMIDIHNYLRKNKCKSKLILQVHDELVFDLHKDEKEKLQEIIKEKMESVMPEFEVPILVEMGLGQNWLEAH